MPELGVEVVRRPTGGRALLHGADLTYAVALPRPDGPAGHVDAVYRTIAAGLIAGLAGLGVTASVGEERGPAGPVCFAAAQGADLRVGNRKLCGSAQVQRGERRAPARLGAARPARRSTSSTCSRGPSAPTPGTRARIRARRA